MVTIIDMPTKKSHDYPDLPANVDGVAKALVRFKDDMARTSGTKRSVARAYTPTKELAVIVAMESGDGR